MRGVRERPAGLSYLSDLLSPAEEEELLARVGDLALEPIALHGTPSRRVVHHFGVDYDFDRRTARPTDPIPPYLLELRRRCAELAGVPEESLVEALVTRYPEGAGIGWHRDAPPFGSHVVGVSLAADCTMHFQRRTADGQRFVYELPLTRRSAYVLSGAARYTWQHRIPEVGQERWSVTFRQLR